MIWLAAVADHLRDRRKGPPNPGLQRLMDDVAEGVALARDALSAAEVEAAEADACSLAFDAAAERIFAIVPPLDT